MENFGVSPFFKANKREFKDDKNENSILIRFKMSQRNSRLMHTVRREDKTATDYATRKKSENTKSTRTINT